MAGGPDANISGELCSGDMLLDALVACAGVTLKAVATALEIDVQDGKITAEGDLDFRGTFFSFLTYVFCCSLARSTQQWLHSFLVCFL